MKGIEYCILLLVSIICWAACVPTTDEWDEFKRKFNKRLESETEEVYRMKIFHEKLKYIAEQNLRFVNGEISYSSGINKFSDLTYEEFESRFTGDFMNPNVIRANASESTFPTKSDSVELTRPDSLDWREIGAVTPVKNEGRCRSGWAFSAIGTLEGYNFMKTGKLVSFREQQLVDCDQDDDGCIGGSPYVALMYAKNNGITLESSYPYEGKQGNCRINSTHKVVRCNGVRALPMFNEEELRIAVNTIGPIAVELHVNCALANYARGVFDHPTCHRNLNHAALLVGYDTTTDGRDYWIVKNSWGEEWGEQGYIRIIRHKNMCRIADSAMYPI